MGSNNQLLGSIRSDSKVVMKEILPPAIRYHAVYPDGIRLDGATVAIVDDDPSGGWVDSKEKLKVVVEESVVFSFESVNTSKNDLSEGTKRKSK